MLRSPSRALALFVCLLLAACGGAAGPVAKGTVIPLAPAQTPDLTGMTDFAPPTPVPLAPALPPGNGRLFYRDRASNRGVMMIPAEGGEPQVIGRFKTGEGIMLLRSWAPNYQSALATGGSANETKHYYATDSDGGDPRYLGAVPAVCQVSLRPVWAPDGTKAVVLATDTASGSVDDCGGPDPLIQTIYLLDLQQRAVRKLAEDPAIFEFDFEKKTAWSPDGSMIAYATSEKRSGDGFGELKILSLVDPRPEIRLRDLWIGRVFWPAADEILIQAPCDGAQHTQLCSFDPASGHAEPAYRTEADAYFWFDSLSPDGNWLLATEYNRNLVLLINRSTGVTETIPDAAGLVGHTAIWAPNGRYVAMIGRDSQTYAYEIGSGRAAAPLMSDELWAWLP